jgi:hypothetical protein
MVIYIPYMAFSLFISFKDIKSGLISRTALFLAIFFSIIGQWLLWGRATLASTISGFLLGITLFALSFLCSHKKLGLADIWYAGLMGSIFGPLWFYPAVIIAALTAFCYMLATHNRSVPFIPFMSAGSLIVLPLYIIAGAGRF